MSLNLISDRWIPVIRASGARDDIRPDQIAEEDVVELNWPRGDFKLACLELLIGLIQLADPPASNEEWRRRYDAPEPERTRKKLSKYAPHFNLGGDGPRFLQDMEQFEDNPDNKAKVVDMLFIDSSGEKSAKENTDLMVKRNRNRTLSAPMAAMALYTLQAFAPAGGAGNRTSMRGGGPLVTLNIPDPDPEKTYKPPLWQVIWGNVLVGEPLSSDQADRALPWLLPTTTSENDEVVIPADRHKYEAYFGMPRRLRLLFEENGDVKGVIQRPKGINYAQWRHPLSPYGRKEADEEIFPIHSDPEQMMYINWKGIIFGETETNEISMCLREYYNRAKSPPVSVLVGGWDMDKMKPRNFSLDIYPAFKIKDDETKNAVESLLFSAKRVGDHLDKALKLAFTKEGGKPNARVCEDAKIAFYGETEKEFTSSIKQMLELLEQDNMTEINMTEIKTSWLRYIREDAFGIYKQLAISGLSDRAEKAERIAKGLLYLRKCLFGDRIRQLLGIKGDRKEEKA